MTRHLTLGILVLALMITATLFSACATTATPTKVTTPTPTAATASSPAPTTPTAAPLQGKIAVSGAWALYPMMVKWAEEFQKLHPEVRIDVSAGGAGKGAADALAGLVDPDRRPKDVYYEKMG